MIDMNIKPKVFDDPIDYSDPMRDNPIIENPIGGIMAKVKRAMKRKKKKRKKRKKSRD
jgi:hypothetical protein